MMGTNRRDGGGVCVYQSLFDLLFFLNFAYQMVSIGTLYDQLYSWYKLRNGV